MRGLGRALAMPSGLFDIVKSALGAEGFAVVILCARS
jgi:hypothetical protein